MDGLMKPEYANAWSLGYTSTVVRKAVGLFCNTNGSMHVVLRRRTHLTSIVGSPINALHIRYPLGIFRKTSFRPFSKDMSETVSDSSSHSTYQASEDLKGLQWPEESLTSTVNEGAGFYSVRLGETFDDGRFVITRKLGWGGFSSVWLARDRKYVLETISLYPRFTSKIKR
jgi:hypothetical protein